MELTPICTWGGVPREHKHLCAICTFKKTKKASVCLHIADQLQLYDLFLFPSESIASK